MSKAEFLKAVLVASLCLLLPDPDVFGESDTNGVTGLGGEDLAAEAVKDESLRAYLRVQEQIHESMLAIERGRQQAEETAARNSNALAQRLQAIEHSLSVQRAGQLAAVEHANSTLLIVVSLCAILGCFAVVVTAILQWRAVNRFTTVSSALVLGNGSDSSRALTVVEGADGAVARIGPAQALNTRLVEALERLERRIEDLERTSHPGLKDAAGNGSDFGGSPGTRATEVSATESDNGGTDSAAALLARGQLLLDEMKPEEAMACFDEVLGVNPTHAEALVKKGAALEQLRRTQDALDCYDRAIAADGSMTIAYLYKGGLFNRLERFTEALACYEQALRTQDRRRNEFKE